MTSTNNLTSQQTHHPASLSKRLLQGGTVGLILISIFLLGAGDPDPEWGKLWMIRPLVIVPLAGAVGGAFYYLMDGLRYRGVWAKIGANILSLLVYIVILWIGTVLGLDGTMWD